MKLACRIVLEYDNESDAVSIFEALRSDNEGYLSFERKGKKLIFTVESDNPMSVSNTLNDLLACVRAAEDSIS